MGWFLDAESDSREQDGTVSHTSSSHFERQAAHYVSQEHSLHQARILKPSSSDGIPVPCRISLLVLYMDITCSVCRVSQALAVILAIEVATEDAAYVKTSLWLARSARVSATLSHLSNPSEGVSTHTPGPSFLSYFLPYSLTRRYNYIRLFGSFMPRFRCQVGSIKICCLI